MFLEEVARYLQSQDLVMLDPAGTSGDVFFNDRPAAPDNVVVLGETGGLAPRDSFSSGIDRPSVQVWVRHTRMAEAEAKALAIYHALHGLASRTLAGGTELIQATAIQRPFYLGRDENQRAEYVFNIRFEIEGNRPTY